ncbi:MAG: hypothetical protein BZ135_01095 [Methanosphaera sp. rholeuAM6]|nr:MAG: hypothetical protein BZ135_01095 [Methanosphaera sp. rholeuAM6]
MVFNNDGNGYTQQALSYLSSDKVVYFAAGLVAAYAIKKFSETEFAHEAAVNITAGALELKDSIEESIENIKEDAEDIHAEAQERQQIEIFGPEDLDDIEDLEIEDIDIDIDDD